MIGLVVGLGVGLGVGVGIGLDRGRLLLARLPRRRARPDAAASSPAATATTATAATAATATAAAGVVSPELFRSKNRPSILRVTAEWSQQRKAGRARLSARDPP